MNSELEALILAYDAASAARDLEVEPLMRQFESLLGAVKERQPGISPDLLRRSIVRAHRKWALRQENKPTVIPPHA